MALFTIADLHLSHGVEKPMDIFGGRWQGYMDKIEKNWRALVGEQDTVVIGGDVSWGIDLKQARADFLFLRDLPGRKIILKGNHDLWWNTVKKMNEFLAENHISNIDFLFNNCFFYGKTALCGTRGWFFEEDFKESHDEKIFRRELIRLETSLKAAKAGNPEEIYCFLHYPPLYINFRCGEIIELMQRYGVSRCIYGHLHSEGLRYAVEGLRDGIDFKLVSGDHIDFAPVRLKGDA
ncbi:MAG: serine/threonine protein phosphatase [Clostridia bacterium]|nr:serine/threonine protein phosphatase [Clostridia bacterium]